eukprot:TRINITY_DN11928_c0_g1_i13.p1 TRINITY_DN11928_c0_g1~~TRINITY_DN11928_c0_g1_i13.p1  ORF type:complete len:263 (+),score=51.84 TRINITY_DN11928_c0_g1_i13:1407-2195(+)
MASEADTGHPELRYRIDSGLGATCIYASSKRRLASLTSFQDVRIFGPGEMLVYGMQRSKGHDGIPSADEQLHICKWWLEKQTRDTLRQWAEAEEQSLTARASPRMNVNDGASISDAPMDLTDTPASEVLFNWLRQAGNGFDKYYGARPQLVQGLVKDEDSGLWPLAADLVEDSRNAPVPLAAHGTVDYDQLGKCGSKTVEATVEIDEQLNGFVAQAWVNEPVESMIPVCALGLQSNGIDRFSLSVHTLWTKRCVYVMELYAS